MSNPRSRRGKLRARDKGTIEAGVATLSEGANFGEKGSQNSWLLKKSVRLQDSQGKSMQKVNRFLKILYIFDGNAHEDSKVRVSIKDEGLIGKKMREVMLAKEKPIMLEKVSLSKGDLEIKKVEPKSNQSTPFAAAIETVLAASKLVGMVEKKMSRDSEAIKK